MADQDVPTIQLDEAEILADAPATQDVKEEKVESETTSEESSPKETKEPEATETEGDETTEGEESQEESEADETTGEEKPLKGAEVRKEQLSGEIRDLVSQRNNIRQEVERLNAQVYQPQTPDEVMAETGQDAINARLTAMEQQRAYEKYNNDVAEAQLTIGTESERVLNDFPMFNPNSDQFNAQVAGQAAQLLSQNIIVDPNTGQITGSNLSPYQLYKTIADAHSMSAVENQIQGQRNTEKMLASADPTSSVSSTKETKEDPFLTGLTSGLAN